VGVELVVPAELRDVSIDSERGGAGRDRHAALDGRIASRLWRVPLGPLLVAVRHLMPHVEERFLVHGFVLEQREHALGAIQHRRARPIHFVVQQHVLHQLVARIGERLDRVASRPRRRAVRQAIRQTAGAAGHDSATRQGQLMPMTADNPYLVDDDRIGEDSGPSAACLRRVTPVPGQTPAGRP
jgi:hypothetical protein